MKKPTPHLMKHIEELPLRLDAKDIAYYQGIDITIAQDDLKKAGSIGGRIMKFQYVDYYYPEEYAYLRKNDESVLWRQGQAVA